MKAIAAWWREFDKYNRHSTRYRVTVAAVSAGIGLGLGMTLHAVLR